MTDRQPDITDLPASKSRLGVEWPKQDRPTLYQPHDSGGDSSERNSNKVDISQDLGCLADLGGCFTIIAVLIIASVVSAVTIL